jgi:TolA-binding protein
MCCVEYKIYNLEQQRQICVYASGLRRERSLMRHALRVTRKAVLFFAVLTTATVWSRPLTAQPQETPASPEQQAQDVQQLKAKLQQLEQMMDEMKGKLNELEGQPVSNHASEISAASTGPLKRCV